MPHDSTVPTGRSFRCTPAARLRVNVRSEGDLTKPREIVGYAAVFNQPTTLYEGRYWTWREVIRPGAFARAIREQHDVRSLFNHDANFVLGRTASGTLSLVEDETGLLSTTLPPDTQTVRDLVLTPIARGDMTGMSFAFTPKRADKTVVTENPDGSTVVEAGGIRTTIRFEGDRCIEEDEILDVELYDVSPVTYPAYEGTNVSARSAPDLARLIAEKDVPHVRRVPTPRLDEARRIMNARAGSARVKK